MTNSLIFVIITAAFLALLGYWILDYLATDETARVPVERFNFESASELAVNETDEFYLGQDAIKIKLAENDFGLGFWNLSKSKWQEVCDQNGGKPDIGSLVLRLTEAGEMVHYADMWVKTTAGQHRFKMKPLHSYYLTLGIYNNRRFIPILTSNTIMLHR